LVQEEVEVILEEGAELHLLPRHHLLQFPSLVEEVEEVETQVVVFKAPFLFFQAALLAL